MAVASLAKAVYAPPIPNDLAPLFIPEKSANRTVDNDVNKINIFN